MKRTQLSQGLFFGLLLVVSAVNATEYPAADFQPKVLYQDESVAAAPAATNTQTPCVNQAVTSKKEEVAAEFDARYPASNFQPKVIFSEAN